ncbi:MAG: 4Fe-4S binding protein [Thiolinea sp.]
MSSPLDWIRQLKQEWTIPEIHPQRCVHSLCEISECSRCVDSCPQDAWLLDDEKLAIDTGRCDGCGLCVVACPEAALDIPLSAALTEYQGGKTLLFACEAAGTGADRGVIPCLHAISQHTLLDYYQAGYRQIISACGDCNTCPRHNRQTSHDHHDPFRLRLKELNRLLASRTAATIRHARVSGDKWTGYLHNKAHHKAEPGSNTIRQRRHFLGNAAIRIVEYGLGEHAQQKPHGSWAKKLPTPVHADNNRKSGKTSSAAALYPYVPEFDITGCNGCDACIRLCPHQAITLSYTGSEARIDSRIDSRIDTPINTATNTPDPEPGHNHNSAEPAYQITAKNCTGCLLCVEACDRQPTAIRIKRLSALTDSRIALLEANCSRCGNPFHYPATDTGHRHTLCPVCTTTRYRQRLFQVD